MKSLSMLNPAELNPMQFLPLKKTRKAPPTVVGFSETPSHYLVRFDMPEFLGDDVSVEVLNDELVVHGHDRRRPGGEARAVSLKLDTDRKGVFARYENGILIVALPKDPQAGPSLTLVKH